MRWKSSDLFSSTRRNSCQLLGTCLFPSTCLLIPLPLFVRGDTGVRGFIMLTTAAPSRITMWASCALTMSWCGTSSETHNKRSDFVPDLKAPWLDREGGYDWFSCEKNQPCQCVELDRQYTGWKTRFGHFWVLSPDFAALIYLCAHVCETVAVLPLWWCHSAI